MIGLLFEASTNQKASQKEGEAVLQKIIPQLQKFGYKIKPLGNGVYRFVNDQNIFDVDTKEYSPTTGFKTKITTNHLRKGISIAITGGLLLSLAARIYQGQATIGDIATRGLIGALGIKGIASSFKGNYTNWLSDTQLASIGVNRFV